jgi:hypothetical protein
MVLVIFGVPRVVQWGFFLAGNPITFEARIGLTIVCVGVAWVFWGSRWRQATPPETR